MFSCAVLFVDSFEVLFVFSSSSAASSSASFSVVFVTIFCAWFTTSPIFILTFLTVKVATTKLEFVVDGNSLKLSILNSSSLSSSIAYRKSIIPIYLPSAVKIKSYVFSTPVVCGFIFNPIPSFVAYVPTFVSKCSTSCVWFLSAATISSSVL